MQYINNQNKALLIIFSFLDWFVNAGNIPTGPATFLSKNKSFFVSVNVTPTTERHHFPLNTTSNLYNIVKYRNAAPDMTF